MSTCVDAAPQDVVSDDTELRAAISAVMTTQSFASTARSISWHPFPTIDDTTLTLVGDDSTTDGINGADTHKILTATFSARRHAGCVESDTR